MAAVAKKTLPGADPVTGEPRKPQQASTKVGRAGVKVTVACKIPNGLVLRLHDWHEEEEPVFGGGTKVKKMARPNGLQIVLNGSAVPFGVIPSYPIIGGYALTHNVDAELWDEWCRQNAKADVLTKKQIFAYEKPDDAAAAAKDHESVRSGLEPINPGTIKKPDGREMAADPRMPRGGPGITAVTTEALPR